MTKLPTLSGQELTKILIENTEYYFHHQRGSHIILRRDNPRKPLSIPNHKTLKKGTILGIIKNIDLSRNDFLKLLKR